MWTARSKLVNSDNVSQISILQSDRPFEFVLVNNPRLAKVQPSSHSFKQYFQSAKDIVTFANNLSNDAVLVVPCPITEESAYPHLAAFVRHAPTEQQHLLWQTLGREIEANLGD